ncbi:acyl-CoA thioesterase [Marinilabiliaceae bacterium JC017]|nr:acyl-CoA thioesterase [Marinilabiliaceae bacterium JC017]
MEEKNTLHFNHVIPVQVRFNDVDMLGHVNNATLQEYFDLGRMHYLQDVSKDDLFKGDEALIIASVKTDFFHPVFLKDNMVVKTKIVHLGTKSLRMVQELVEKDSQVIKSSCESVMVGIHKVKGYSIELPVEWRVKIGNLEKDLA